MQNDQDRPEDWMERAVEQARVLRETVRNQPDLRELVDLFLFRLGQRIADGGS